MVKNPTRRIAPVLAAVIAAGLAGTPAASADFSIARCTGDSVTARGASFQTNAFTGFTAAFRSATEPGCGTTAPAVTLEATGSGAGRQALGARGSANTTGARDPLIRLAASDEPLTATDRQQIEKGAIDANGVDVTSADDNPVHLIPVAIGSVAIMLHLPDSCNYSSVTNRPLDGNRPALDNETLEKAFAGDAGAVTWGQLLPGLATADAACAAKTVNRVVRQDSSGTTFALKQLLHRINPTRGWAALGNTAWPNIATAPVYRSTDSGGGALRSALNDNNAIRRDNGSGTPTATNIDYATAGGIGYADLATARGGTGQPFLWADSGTDTRFWVPLQRGTSANPKAGSGYDDPQSVNDGYKTSVSNAVGGPRGSSCGAVTPRNAPTSTFGDWSLVDATATGEGYAGCTLTYQIAFDDYSVVYCNSPEEERKARTVKDFLTLELSNAGQTALAGYDYARLPSAVYATALTGANAVGWKKDGSSGRPCQPVVTVEPTPTPTATPTGNNNPTPPPPAPSNAITVSSARVSGTTIRLALQVPGAGRISVASSAKPKKGAAVKLAAKNVTANAAGAQTVTLSLDSKAKTSLKKNKSLKFTLSITYTPNGGTAKTVTKTVTVKQPKATKKK